MLSRFFSLDHMAWTSGNPFCLIVERNPALAPTVSRVNLKKRRLVVVEPTQLKHISPRISGTQNGGTAPYKAIFLGWVFPFISLTYSLYIGEYLHFRYLKCLVNMLKSKEHTEPIPSKIACLNFAIEHVCVFSASQVDY